MTTPSEGKAPEAGDGAFAKADGMCFWIADEIIDEDGCLNEQQTKEKVDRIKAAHAAAVKKAVDEAVAEQKKWAERTADEYKDEIRALKSGEHYAAKALVEKAVADQKEKDAGIAENEQEPDITAPTPEAIEAMKRNPALVVLAAVRVTKKNIAAAIRSAE